MWIEDMLSGMNIYFENRLLIQLIGRESFGDGMLIFFFFFFLKENLFNLLFNNIFSILIEEFFSLSLNMSKERRNLAEGFI